MATVFQFMSILLGCVIREVYYVAALPVAFVSGPPAAWQSQSGYFWPPQGSHGWGHAGLMPPENPTPFVWQQPHGNIKVPGPKQVDPNVPWTTVKPTAESRWTTERPQPQAHAPQAKHSAFEFNLKVPISNTEDKNKGHGKTYIMNRGEDDHSQFYRPSQFQLESHLHSPSKVSSHSGSSNYPNKDPEGASKPGFHFSLSLPISSTTAAPQNPSSGTNFENAGFSNPGSSQTRFFHYPHKVHGVNKPMYQKPSETQPMVQKPAESKLVNFFTGLLNQQRGPGDQNIKFSPQTEHSHMFKPVLPQQPSRPGPSGSLSGHHSPSNYWMGQAHFSTLTNPGSGVQNPTHQAVQSAVRYSPQWYQVQMPAISDYLDVRNNILQSVQYVNGQLMIPLEKCPGFEGFAAHSHHGQVHHHHQSPPSGQTPAKPHYAKVFMNMEGTTPNVNNEPSDQSGVHQEYPSRWWQHTDTDPQSWSSQNTRLEQTSVQPVNPLPYLSYWHKEPNIHHSNVRPGQTNYVVQLGTNVGYDRQPESNVQYVMPQRRHHH